MKSMWRASGAHRKGKDVTFFGPSERYYGRMGRFSRQFTRHLRCLTLLVLVPLPAISQQPHQHGVVTLNLALEERVLLLEVTWPLLDLMGFEHWPPRDDVEQDRFDRSIGVISDSRSVFSLSREAKCKIKDFVMEEPPQNVGNDETDHAPSSVEGETHVNLTVSYRFKCKSPDELTEIRVHLFRLFPGLQSLQANLVTETAQTFQQLTFVEPVLFLPR